MTDRLLDVRDPLALRALAHPLRVRLLRLVREHRPVTGARLAELVGESTASVSYHLSVLARHGFIEPDPAPGPTRRHKPWRTTFDRLQVTGAQRGVPPVQTPEGAVLATLLDAVREDQDAYLAGTARLAPEWEDVGTFALSRLVLTPDAVERMTSEVQAVLDRYRGHEASEVPTGCSRVSVSFVAVPTAEPAAEPGAEPERSA